jgi:uncharacterized protein YsxB (DUF464 family)
MIKISIYQNEEAVITGFKLSGHAGYADHGQDIVCAAVSALVFNAINSIEQFTDDKFTIDQNEDGGKIEFHVTSSISEESKLLLNSLFLGLSGIQEDYGQKFIKFTSA